MRGEQSLASGRSSGEIARLLGGFAKTKAKGRAAMQRPVAIVDASAKKALSITVEVPPPLPAVDRLRDLAGPLDDEEADPDARSIWPQVHARLVERIRAARSTMIFVNSRRLAERLATALNETAGEEIALAHHGSVDDGLEELLDRTHPEVAVISVGLGNDYGHPTPSTLHALEAADGLRLYRTDLDGRVVVESDGTRIWVRSER
jgi:Lhr-like helicase